jgi:hypothetical protein
MREQRIQEKEAMKQAAADQQARTASAQQQK